MFASKYGSAPARSGYSRDSTISQMQGLSSNKTARTWFQTGTRVRKQDGSLGTVEGDFPYGVKLAEHDNELFIPETLTIVA